MPESKHELEEREGLLENREPSEDEEYVSEQGEEVEEEQVDSRFHQPTPSPLKRIGLLLFIGLLFWLAFSLRNGKWLGDGKPKIVHASRYSKEHKFRPAASPIVTETMKDGRLRVRGAAPTASVTPTPTPALKKKSKSKSKKKKGLGKRSKKVKKFTGARQ